MILHELEHNITLGRVWIEALIALFIVFLIEDNLILTLCHSQVVSCSVHTQRVRFQSARDAPLGQGVGVHGDKEVGLVPVGDVGTGMQRDEHIGLTRVDDLHVRTVTFHQPSEGQCHVQIDGFLLGQRTHGTRIMTTMTCVNDQRKLLGFCSSSIVGSMSNGNCCQCRQHKQSCQNQYSILHFGCKSTDFPSNTMYLLLSFIIY